MIADRKKAIAEHLKVIPGHFHPIAEHFKVIPGHFYLIAEHLNVLAGDFHSIAMKKKCSPIGKK